MFIPIKEESLNISESVLEKHNWNQWIWNSHKWVEYYKGYYKCEFCKKTWTNMIPITDDIPLCGNNPFLNNALNNLNPND